MPQHIWAAGVWGLAAVTLTGAALMGQTRQTLKPAPAIGPQDIRTSTGGEGAAKITTGEFDHEILKQLIRFDEQEIAAAQMAQQRASSPYLKQLAAEILQDHSGLLKRLQAVKTPPPAPASSPPGSPGAEKRDATKDFLRLLDEIGQRSQRSLTLELSQQNGQQFDHEFLYSQLFGQLWIIDALTVFEANASAELKPILQQWIQIAQYHLTRCKTTLARIDRATIVGDAAGGIFHRETSTSPPGAAIGHSTSSRGRTGLSPLPTTTRSPSGKTVGPAQGSP